MATIAVIAFAPVFHRLHSQFCPPRSHCYYAMPIVFLMPQMLVCRVLVPGSVLIPLILKWHSGKPLQS